MSAYVEQLLDDAHRELAARLAAEVSGPVRWTTSMRLVAADGAFACIKMRTGIHPGA